MPTDVGNEPQCTYCNVTGPDISVELVETASSGHIELCVDCIGELVGCIWCGRQEHIEDTLYTRDGSVCEPCSSYVASCADCGDAIHEEDGNWDDYGEYFYCDRCYGGDYHGGVIRSWGDRPTMRYIHANADHTPMGKPHTFYMGMEIEVHGIRPDTLQEAQGGAIPTFQGWVTTDASVNGYELVTFPGTYDAWMNGDVIDWDRWRRNIHERVPNQEDFNDNGIHVHVSRTGFYDKKGNHSAAHQFKWMTFIQTFDQPIKLLAGRDRSGYCDWDYGRDLETRYEEARKLNQYTDRYRPINSQNEHTLEVRIFDGRTDETFIKRVIEFIHSTVEFTRLIKSKVPQWSDYEEYITANAEMYPLVKAWIDTPYDGNLYPRDLAIASRVITRRQMREVYAKKKEERKRRIQEEIDRRRRLEEAERRIQDIIDNGSACNCVFCDAERNGEIEHAS